MKEHPPYDHEPAPENPRDRALHQMCREGWAIASGGLVSAPTGHFDRVTNTPEELAEIKQAFKHFDFEAIDVTGNFLVVQDFWGEIEVSEFETSDELTAAYQARLEQFEGWCREQGV